MSDYGNRTSKRQKLNEDTGRDAYTARRRGWKIDNDGWWFRKLLKGQPAITDCRVGFDTARRVYVRSAALALRYDAKCAA